MELTLGYEVCSAAHITVAQAVTENPVKGILMLFPAYLAQCCEEYSVNISWKVSILKLK